MAKRSLNPFLVLIVFLFGPASLQAFPEGVAHFILGRPVTEQSLMTQLKPMFTILDPIVRGSDGITTEKIKVGTPKAKLSVLIVEPRHYGFRMEEKISITDKSLSYNLNINGTGEEVTELMKKLMPVGGTQESVKASDVPPDQIEKVLEEVVRVSSRKVSAKHPRTLFLLNGYGVPKKMGLPLAILLAGRGYRVILPDLRGQGESGGKGVTWGKEEPRDLEELLTELQSRRIVEDEPVGVIGVSYGAAMASLWAAHDKRVQVTVLAAPYRQADTKIVSAFEMFLGGVKIPFKLSKESLAKGTAIASDRLGVSWEALSPAQAVTKVSHPILFLSSTGDEVIPAKEVKGIYEAAPKGSKLHEFEKLPHLLIGANFVEMEGIILKWLQENGFAVEVEETVESGD